MLDVSAVIGLGEFCLLRNLQQISMFLSVTNEVQIVEVDLLKIIKEG